MQSGLKQLFAAIAVAGLSMPASAEGDAAKGKKQFSICKACHAVGEGAKIRMGPPLNNIIGRTAGSYEGAEKKYSKMLKSAGANGLVWNEETISGYLVNPTNFLRDFLKTAGKEDLATGKSKMIIRIKQDKKRANVIAYLKTFSKSE